MWLHVHVPYLDIPVKRVLWNGVGVGKGEYPTGTPLSNRWALELLWITLDPIDRTKNLAQRPARFLPRLWFQRPAGSQPMSSSRKVKNNFTFGSSHCFTALVFVFNLNIFCTTLTRSTELIVAIMMQHWNTLAAFISSPVEWLLWIAHQERSNSEW